MGLALLIRFLEKKASDVKMSTDCLLFLIYNYFFWGSFPQFKKKGEKRLHKTPLCKNEVLTLAPCPNFANQVEATPWGELPNK